MLNVSHSECTSDMQKKVKSDKYLTLWDITYPFQEKKEINWYNDLHLWWICFTFSPFSDRERKTHGDWWFKNSFSINSYIQENSCPRGSCSWKKDKSEDEICSDFLTHSLHCAGHSDNCLLFPHLQQPPDFKSTHPVADPNPPPPAAPHATVSYSTG